MKGVDCVSWPQRAADKFGERMAGKCALLQREKLNSAVTAKQQLFKARRKAGVSSTKSLQLTEGLNDKYQLITEYIHVKCLLSCRICFQDC